MNRMLLVAVSITITAMIVGIAITQCGCTLPAADDFRVLGISAIMVGVLVTFLYIIHVSDLNPGYRYSISTYGL